MSRITVCLARLGITQKVFHFTVALRASKSLAALTDLKHLGSMARTGDSRKPRTSSRLTTRPAVGLSGLQVCKHACLQDGQASRCVTWELESWPRRWLVVGPSACGDDIVEVLSCRQCRRHPPSWLADGNAARVARGIPGRFVCWTDSRMACFSASHSATHKKSLRDGWQSS